ncbi:MAG: cytochrome c3 family protein [Planctomycetota bacterium]
MLTRSRFWTATLSLLTPAVLILASFSPTQDEQDQDEDHGGNVVYHVKSKKMKNLLSVLYSHDDHIGYGYKCEDCHGGEQPLYEQEIGANVFTMKDINSGKSCGHCHNGKTEWKGGTVYAPRRNCERCHDVTIQPMHAEE